VRAEGFLFSLEALLALLLFALLLLSFPKALFQKTSLEELYVLQKADDLLKVWSVERNFSKEELLSDIAFVFPGNCVELLVDGKALSSCNPSSSKTISANAWLLGDFLSPFEIRLVVHY